jgi:MraZ protein
LDVSVSHLNPKNAEGGKEREAVANDTMTGTFPGKLDQKSRISVPSQLRGTLGEMFYLTFSDKNCLEGYTEEAYKRISDEFDEIDPDEGLHWRANTAPCRIDAQGRVFIPPKFRNKIGLGERVTIVGNGSMILFWNTDEWESVNDVNCTREKYAEMKKRLRERREQKLK